MALRRKKAEAKSRKEEPKQEPVVEPAPPKDPRRFLNPRDRKAAEEADKRAQIRGERKAAARS